MENKGLEIYVIEDGKRLRCGYTTGTTAALAARAAVRVLFMMQEGKCRREDKNRAGACMPGDFCGKAGRDMGGPGYFGPEEQVVCPGKESIYIPCSILTPKGIPVEADALVCETGRDPDYAVCAVRKDGGDDKDVTNGLLIYARAEFMPEGSDQRKKACEFISETGDEERIKDNIVIECSEGIGTVTKPGLPVPVGEKALNPVPGKMIREAVREEILASEKRSHYREELSETAIDGEPEGKQPEEMEAEGRPERRPVKEDRAERTQEQPQTEGRAERRPAEGRGIRITLYVPEGEKIVRSTFNGRLGIVGGISIIGTSGIVEPMSKKAFADAVCLEIRQQAELGAKKLILTPGNYGEDFIRRLRSETVVSGEREGFMESEGLASAEKDASPENPGSALNGKGIVSNAEGFFVRETKACETVCFIGTAPETAEAALKTAASAARRKEPEEETVSRGKASEFEAESKRAGGSEQYSIVVCSNFIGEALDEAIADGFEEVFLIGHAGKLVKLAGGIMNTHSRMADCRMELICAHAAVCGAGQELCKRIMAASTTEAAFSLIRNESEELLRQVLNSLLSAVQFHLKERLRKHEKGEESTLRFSAIMFFK